MVNRSFWLRKIEEFWVSRSIIWISGVRRVGKTVLCQSLPNIEYFDCELPRIRKQLEDPELFLFSVKGKRIVLDEIHRLENPSELLKIAADHYPKTKVIATGSSTLAASIKFKDTLAGRKNTLLMTPMIAQDLKDFGASSLIVRFLQGGLPPFFISETKLDREYIEWLDAYWSKDILELFRLERRYSFLKFVEMIFIQSGTMFEASRFASPCEVSRTTIGNYLSVMEATFIVHVIRPYSTNKTMEIVSAPKVYAFDTGFVAYYKGWQELRDEDSGLLWEHYVLNELIGVFQTPDIHYWRDKNGHEVDFVITRRTKQTDTIECKWSDKSFDTTNLVSYRKRHPDGRNFVVIANLKQSYKIRAQDLIIQMITLDDLVKELRLM
jgi:uncharacterized protein